MNHQPWTRERLLQTSGSFWTACALHAGVKLEVFTAIGRVELTGDQVAGKIGAEPRATKRLVNALAALGLLIKNGQSYAVAEEVRPFLIKSERMFIGHMIDHHHHLVESWAKLPQAVKTGRPVRARSVFDDPERLEAFLMGMFTLGMGIAPGLAKKSTSRDGNGCWTWAAVPGPTPFIFVWKIPR